MTLSYLNEMNDVIGINVSLRKLMRFLRIETDNSVPPPLLWMYF